MQNDSKVKQIKYWSMWHILIQYFSQWTRLDICDEEEEADENV